MKKLLMFVCCILIINCSYAGKPEQTDDKGEQRQIEGAVASEVAVSTAATATTTIGAAASTAATTTIGAAASTAATATTTTTGVVASAVATAASTIKSIPEEILQDGRKLLNDGDLAAALTKFNLLLDCNSPYRAEVDAWFASNGNTMGYVQYTRARVFQLLAGWENLQSALRDLDDILGAQDCGGALCKNFLNQPTVRGAIYFLRGKILHAIGGVEHDKRALKYFKAILDRQSPYQEQFNGWLSSNEWGNLCLLLCTRISVLVRYSGVEYSLQAIADLDVILNPPTSEHRIGFDKWLKNPNIFDMSVASVHILRGKLLGKVGKHMEALAEFDKILDATAPDHDKFASWLNQNQGYKRGTVQFERVRTLALVKGKENPEVLAELDKILAPDSPFRAQYDTWLKFSENSIKLHYERITILKEIGPEKYQEALAEIDQILNPASPDRLNYDQWLDCPGLVVRRAELYFLQGEMLKQIGAAERKRALGVFESIIDPASPHRKQFMRWLVGHGDLYRSIAYLRSQIDFEDKFGPPPPFKPEPLMRIEDFIRAPSPTVEQQLAGFPEQVIGSPHALERGDDEDGLKFFRGDEDYDQDDEAGGTVGSGPRGSDRSVLSDGVVVSARLGGELTPTAPIQGAALPFLTSPGAASVLRKS